MTKVAELHLVCIDILMSNKQLGRKTYLVGNQKSYKGSITVPSNCNCNLFLCK